MFKSIKKWQWSLTRSVAIIHKVHLEGVPVVEDALGV